MRRDRLRVVVAGMVADVPGQGGWVWAIMNWVLGLRGLGHDVLVVEPVEEVRPGLGREFARVVRSFGLEDRAGVLAERGPGLGLSREDMAAFAADADLLLNVAGKLRDPDLLGAVATRVYLDVDPGFTQVWQHDHGIDMNLEDHTHFLTVGLNVGRPGCPIPTCGVRWIPTLPPVALDAWQPTGVVVHDAWTTVANWRGYGTVEHGGVRYGQKAHSWRRLFALPAGSGQRFAPALDIHPGERDDVAALEQHGWTLQPSDLAATPARYRRFVRGSLGEIGVAKEGYVVSSSGWFSDRSACYLAAGRPVVAQDTGWSEHLPTGGGLLPFGEPPQAPAADAVREAAADYHRHARLARGLAEERLGASRVVAEVLDRLN